MTPQLIFVLIFVVAGAILFLTLSLPNKKSKTYKIEYDEALQRRDKRAALELGRKYYKSLRNGRLTLYDEQAIANDIASIS